MDEFLLINKWYQNFWGNARQTSFLLPTFLGALENEYLGCGCGWRSLVEI